MRFVPIITLIIFFGCNDAEPDTTYEPLEVADIATDSIVDSVIELDTVVDSISIYFANPVDFYALKKAPDDHMLNGGAFLVPDSCFHMVNDSSYVRYDYWVTKFHNNENGRLRALSFMTLKPWATPQNKYYENDNEILVGIKSRVVWDWLGPSNFVELPLSTILEKFGEPDSRRNECVVYYRENKLLVLNIEYDQVAWFQYLWLKDPITDVSELPDECFKWM